MNVNSEITIEEIQHLIGRNILAFQFIEILLKDINLKKNGKGTEKELKNKKKKIMKMSLGDLVNHKKLQLLDSNINLDDGNLELTDPILSFNFLPDTESLEQLQAKLSELSTDRNILVHKLRFNFKVETNLGKIDAKHFLNHQYENLIPLSKELKHISDVLTTRQNSFKTVIESDQFLAEIENIRQSSNKL